MTFWLFSGFDEDARTRARVAAFAASRVKPPSDLPVAASRREPSIGAGPAIRRALFQRPLRIAAGRLP